MFDKYYKCIPMFEAASEQWQKKQEAVSKYITWQTFNNYLLPFQVFRSTTPSTTFTLELLNKEGILQETISVPSNNYEIRTTAGIDRIQYFAQHELLLDCGEYYYHFTDNISHWYSELFAVKNIALELGTGLEIVDFPYLLIELSASEVASYTPTGGVSSAVGTASEIMSI